MSDTPKRIQLRRTKDWRLPPGSASVARPSRWGNPYRPGRPCCFGGALLPPVSTGDWLREVSLPRFRETCPDIATAVTWYRELLDRCPALATEARRTLRGLHLACWCPLDQPCHADVLLAIANAPLRCEAV